MRCEQFETDAVLTRVTLQRNGPVTLRAMRHAISRRSSSCRSTYKNSPYAIAPAAWRCWRRCAGPRRGVSSPRRGHEAHRPSAISTSLSYLRLFVVVDAAAQIADLVDEAHLRNRRFVGPWPWPHVANLSDLTFRLLRRGVEVCTGAATPRSEAADAKPRVFRLRVRSVSN